MSNTSTRMLLNPYSAMNTGSERIYNMYTNSTHADNHLYRMQKLVRMTLWSESVCSSELESNKKRGQGKPLLAYA